MKTQIFFRWLPTAIILWLFGVVFAFCAVVCAVQATHILTPVAMIGDIQQTIHWYWRGAMADALIAVCCILSWHLMRRRQPVTLVWGAIFVMVAAFIISQRSVVYLFRGAGFMYWSDLVLELPFLLYAIIYAYGECRKPAA